MAKEIYRKKSSPSRGVLLKQWSLLIIVFILGYLSASVYQFSTLKKVVIGSFFAKQPLSVMHVKRQVALPQPKFEFYTLLANEKHSHIVKPTTTINHPIATTHPEPIVASKETYLVQVASFRRINEAEKLKASLLLKGFNVGINSATQQGVQWYRVVMGPFSSKQQALQAQHFFAEREHTVGMIRRMDS